MNHQTQAAEPPQDLPAIERIRLGAAVTVLGFVVFMLGAKPEWLGLDRSQVVGFAQITVFVIGLGIICLGGYIGLASLWGSEEKSIPADIGLRLIATGYVISVFTGMADIFGMTLQANPEVPFFGPWQAAGVGLGMAVVALGMLMLVPYHRLRKR